MCLRYVWIVLVIVFIGMGSGYSWLYAANPQIKTGELTIIVSGSELGALKPCGCSGGQLGGLDRRATILNSIPLDKRLVLGTGRLVRTADPQDLTKLLILSQAYNLLGYDVLRFTEEDWNRGNQAGALEMLAGIALIGSQHPAEQVLPNFQKAFAISQGTYTVKVSSLSGQAWQAGVAMIPPHEKNIIQVMVVDTQNLNKPESLPWHSLDVDCVIVPLDGDEPQRIGKQVRPLVFSPGRHGRYLVRLDVGFDKTGGITLSYRELKVSEEIQKDAQLVGLYQMYQQIVRDQQLLENHPKVPLPGDLEYIGSSECQECHETEYATWLSKKHAHAFKTLKDVGSERDPECVLCHVVGLDYEAGFFTEEDTPELKDVGCEVCHGPGSEHARSEGKLKMPEPQWDCLRCHTPEHSGGFSGHEKEYHEKIRHWKEPKAVEVVQK